MLRVNRLLAIALIAWMAPAAAQQSVMTPTEFAAELQRLSGEVSNVGEPGAVRSINVPAVWSVEAGGERYDVPALWLRSSLEDARRDPASWPSERAKVLTHLEALRLEAEALTGTVEQPGRPAPAEARAALAEVLARPEFKGMAQEGAFVRLRERLTEWLISVWQRLGGPRLGSRSTAILFAWIAVFVAAGALAIWLRRFLRQADRQQLALTPSPAARTPAGAWARQALAAADPRDAVRCAYRAVVSGLEEEGVWRSDDTRTPREYLRLLPVEHRRRPLVADVSRRFEEIWFGARAATDDDRAVALARLREIGCLPAD
ncbi:MAG TPA: DUF4129 domain-containing protein [Vicinamibacterales bacterium]